MKKFLLPDNLQFLNVLWKFKGVLFTFFLTFPKLFFKRFYNVCVPLGNWKLSTLTPNRKISHSNNASDFRLINQLLVYEKVLELVIQQQLEDFFENSNVLIEEQSGFRGKYSCETALQLVLDDWTSAISEKYYVGVIFIDYRGAFETINRHLLINKLFLYNIRGKALDLFK